MARIVYGQNNSDSAALTGKTVGQARAQYGTAFNIPDGLQATVGGLVVGDDYQLRGTDTLVFAAPTGQKGQ